MSETLFRLRARLEMWSYRRRLRNLTEAEYLSCCSCGTEGVATRQYYSMTLGDAWAGIRHDWAACDTCHNEDSPAGEGLRAAKSKPITPLAEARKKAKA